jgi:hypothetical protein
MNTKQFSNDYKSIKEYEHHVHTMKEISKTEKNPHRIPNITGYPSKDYEKMYKKKEWTKEDQMFEDSLWDE